MKPSLRDIGLLALIAGGAAIGIGMTVSLVVPSVTRSAAEAAAREQVRTDDAIAKMEEAWGRRLPASPVGRTSILLENLMDREREVVLAALEGRRDGETPPAEETLRVIRQKDAMIAIVRGIEATLPSTVVSEAIRETKLAEKLAWSRGVVRQRDAGFALEFEHQIHQDLEAVYQSHRDLVSARSDSMRVARYGKKVEPRS